MSGHNKRKNKNMPDGSYRIGAEGGKVKITDQNIESRIEEINKELEKIRKVEKKFPQGELHSQNTFIILFFWQNVKKILTQI